MGTSFKALAAYLEYGPRDGSRRDRVDWIESRNLPTTHPQAAARIMLATARDSDSVQPPVYHFSVSFAPGDPVNRETMRKVADRTLRDLELQDFQVLIVAHRDKGHPHMHFMVNRVHPERLNVWNNWHDYYRIETTLRAQEVELGLRIVPGRHAPVPEHARHLVRAPAPRLLVGDDAFKAHVTRVAGPHLLGARSWAELEGALAQHGLSVRPDGRGMVVTDGVRKVKCSEIDRTASRVHLERRLGALGEYRARQAVASRTMDQRAAHAPQVQERTPAPEPRNPPPAPQRNEVPRRAEPVRGPDPRVPSRRDTGPVDPPRAPRPWPVAPAPPPPATPGLPSELREMVQRGAAIEEAERRIDEAGKEVHAAKDALAKIPARVKRADAARDNAAARLHEVYADPKAALEAIDAFRRQNSDSLLLAAVKAIPERFGALRWEPDPRLFGIFYRKDTRRAKGTAPLLAVALEHYYATPPPSPEDRAAAQRRVDEARRAMDAAQQARRALPPGHSSVHRRELAAVLRGVGAEVHGGAERLAGLLTTTLPSATHFVARALDAAHREERRQGQQRRGGVGMDF